MIAGYHYHFHLCVPQLRVGLGYILYTAVINQYISLLFPELERHALYTQSPSSESLFKVILSLTIVYSWHLPMPNGFDYNTLKFLEG